MNKGVRFLQSPDDFPCMVDLGGKVPAWGLSRWEGAGLRFRPPDDEGFSLRGNSRQLLYRGRNKSHRITILGDTAFEYDCILNREPDSNVVTLGIDGVEQFDFFKQPDFIKDPFLAGSYAVYRKENFAGHGELCTGTGKLCHIHRPKIIDARGRWVWGDLSITGDRLCITIPENWLSEAAYPVIVDPTVGTSTVGSQTTWYDPDVEETVQLYVEVSQIANRFQITEALNGSGTLTAYVYAYSNNYEAGCRPILYFDYNNYPTTKRSKNEGYFDIAVSGSKPASWRSATFQSNASITAGTYVWFGFASTFFCPRFDYGQKCYKYWIPSETVDSLSLTFDLYSTNDYYDFKVSMYFTYTLPQSYTRTITQGVRLTDTRKLTGTYKRTTTQTVRGTTTLKRIEGFYRKCVMNVQNSMALMRSQTLIKKAAEQIKATMGISNKRDMKRSLTNQTVAQSTMTRKGDSKRTIIETDKPIMGLSRYAGINRNCVMSVKNTSVLTRSQSFIRTVAQQIKATMGISNKRDMKRTLTNQTAAQSTMTRKGDSKRTIIETDKPTMGLTRYAGINLKLIMTGGVSSILYKALTFPRRVVEVIKAQDIAGTFRGIVRKLTVQAGNSETVKPVIGFKRDIVSQVKVNTVISRFPIFFRSVLNTMRVSDVDTYSVIWLRRLPEQETTLDQNRHIGGYIRGLYVAAGSFAETKHTGEYYRKQTDTAHIEAVSLRHLFIFIRLFTTGLVRDFIIRRFLKSNEDIILKSHICRELEIESRIH